jgi:ribosomal protein S18 acetylase RimI-like enzyme
MLQIIEANLFEPNHAEAIVALLKSYAEGPMGGGVPLSEYVCNNLILKLAQRSDLLALLVFDEQLAVGMMIGFEGFSTFHCKPLLNIHDLIVAPSHRRQGIAKMLFKYAEEIATARGYCKVTLEVLEGNLGAQALYRTLGYRGYALDPAMGNALFWEKKL